MIPKYSRRIIETSKTTTAPAGAQTYRPMHTTINSTQFQSTMLDRTGFSIEAIDLLWNYYTELEEDLGESIPFDPVAIRCEWSEEDAVEISVDYDIEGGASTLELIEHLQEHTTVLGTTTDDKILYVAF